MSRFTNEMDFFYQNNGSNFFAGTQIHCNVSQMPQYPFEEFRVSDKQTYRNLNGDAYTYQNYTKAGYRLRWSYLDEAKANEFRLMFDSNPYMVFSGNTASGHFGTCMIVGEPKITEVQFELYDIDFTVEEI